MWQYLETVFQFSSVTQSCQTHVHHVSDAIQPSHPLSSPSPLAFNLSHPIPIRVFSKESVLCIRRPKYWSFSFNISPSNEHPGLISFRMDWLDLFTVQGTLKSLLQHHSSKASFLLRSAFFIVQLSHPYMTTGKTIILIWWTFVEPLLFNILSRLVITFLPSSKHLLISWLQSPSAVILEPRKIKSATVSSVSPSIYQEVMELIPKSFPKTLWALPAGLVKVVWPQEHLLQDRHPLGCAGFMMFFNYHSLFYGTSHIECYLKYTFSSIRTQ